MKLKTSVSLSPAALKMLKKLAKRLNIKKSAVLEVVILEYYDRIHARD